ncbi:MAG: DUF2779 domain-containing protein [Dethiosulfatibacter sp.]|nr:DUF2779 domain-containing protein [Dethiosulfatibacter sp.]
MRYLTKSRFKLALECPTKLYYTGKKQYANQNLEDSFLAALADGGYQVGELAKYYFPDGHDIKSLDYLEALEETNALLEKDQVIIYEAAIRHENLFIRTDILVKRDDHIDIIEVKAKSYNKSKDSFFTKSGSLSSDWSPYLQDVAFQKHVVASAYPNCSVSSYLLLVDKQSKCPTDGLNQKFRISKDPSGRKQIRLAQPLTSEDLSKKILCQINVDDCCNLIYNTEITNEEFKGSFFDFVDFLSQCYEQDKKIVMDIAGRCGKCEFKKTAKDPKALLSGFEECWRHHLDWNDEDFAEPTILEINNFRKKDQLFKLAVYKMKDVTIDDIEPDTDGKPGLSSKERQWLQVEKVQDNDNTPWIDTDGLTTEMNNWRYPLHFIDFETTMVAIPFNQGRHPYEGIAFQFSHHVVHENGEIEHRNQYLNVVPGVFPNYEFVRKLKEALENDRGTIFRYAPHENTFLNLIYTQLKNDRNNIPDREELLNFIRDITEFGKGTKEYRCGDRNMVDMLSLVKRYYYDPLMGGSNSIKVVLPAILNSSRYLQNKYLNPIYGSDGGIKSHNFRNWTWIRFDDAGRVIDPYKLLPKMFDDISDDDFEKISDDTVISDGGAAMTAYVKMQFEDMTDYERNEISDALLKYCELDTLAMVMIYEGWKEACDL